MRAIEGSQVPLLGVIGEQSTGVRMVPENILCEALVAPDFGPTSTKTLAPFFVKAVQPGDELHGGSDLLSQNSDDLVPDVGTHGIEVTADVGDDRQRRRLNVESAENLSQRVDGGSNNLGVEGVTHRQLRGPKPGFLAGLDRRVHRVSRTTDHRLAGAVDVGDNHVAIDRVDDLLDLLQWAER